SHVRIGDVADSGPPRVRPANAIGRGRIPGSPQGEDMDRSRRSRWRRGVATVLAVAGMVLTLAAVGQLRASKDEGQPRTDPRTDEDRHPQVPMAWDEKELADLEVPLARADFTVKHVSAAYYYGLPVRDIYQSYPIYDPRSGAEPKGYLESLKVK